MGYPSIEQKKNFRAGIVGASGYTGSELAGLLAGHPRVELSMVTSRQHAGKRLSDIHPHLNRIVDQVLQPAEALLDDPPDLVFLALPHAIAQDFVRPLYGKGVKIIDMSADFRLKSASVYKHWYATEHRAPELLNQAVYGLPELFRSNIRSSKLVANPGCYPTSVLLALAPLLKENLIQTDSIIIDSKSGATGAGIKPQASTHFSRVFGNFSAYGIGSHRHTPEIEQELSLLSGREISVQFTPHLLPIDRGILSAVYVRPAAPIHQNDLSDLYGRFYYKEKFIRICEAPPEIKHVRGSNYCNLYVKHDARTGNIIIISVLDNLVKGAAGQAVQNMNIMFNLKEDSGLLRLPVYP